MFGKKAKDVKESEVAVVEEVENAATPERVRRSRIRTDAESENSAYSNFGAKQEAKTQFVFKSDDPEQRLNFDLDDAEDDDEVYEELQSGKFAGELAPNVDTEDDDDGDDGPSWGVAAESDYLPEISQEIDGGVSIEDEDEEKPVKVALVGSVKEGVVEPEVWPEGPAGKEEPVTEEEPVAEEEPAVGTVPLFNYLCDTITVYNEKDSGVCSEEIEVICKDDALSNRVVIENGVIHMPNAGVYEDGFLSEWDQNSECKLAVGKTVQLDLGTSLRIPDGCELELVGTKNLRTKYGLELEHGVVRLSRQVCSCPIVVTVTAVQELAYVQRFRSIIDARVVRV